jgi:tRNA pseudouridine55 synthase
MAKAAKRQIHGVFLLNKPLGISSNAALQKVRYLFSAHKAGHTGALDPLASGLLPICLGEATKFSHYLLEANKRYRTSIQLGLSTTTGDAEGAPVQRADVPALSLDVITAVLTGFKGASMQTPPMYSALKQQGRPLYELARQGIDIERAARRIVIEEIKLLGYTAAQIDLEISCSKGTYIRVLGEDIAKALGSCGHLSALHRLETGHFTLNPQYSIDYLEHLSQPERDALLLPAYAAVEYLPRIELPEARLKYFCNGQESTVEHPPTDAILVFYQDKCLGLAKVNAQQRLIPLRVLNY